MKKKNWLAGLMSVGLIASPTISFAQCPSNETTVWQNHYAFEPIVGVTTSLLTPGVLDVAAPTGGTLTKALEVPPGFQIKQVIACSTPAAVGAVLTQFDVSIPLVPGTSLSGLPASCVTFVSADSSLVNPQVAPTALTLDFGANPAIQVTGVGLVLQADPALWNFVPPHQHTYLTGRGRGHNNTTAVTQGLTINGEECGTPASVPMNGNGKNKKK